MRKVFFEKSALTEFNKWEKDNRKIFSRILDLLEDIKRDPFNGIGKPEPLKYQFAGYWSRRINSEHRLIYKVVDNSIIVISCKYHY